MLAMLEALAAHTGLVFDVLDDGHDCVIICSRKDGELLREIIPGFFLEFGMEARIDTFATQFEDIDFCQSKPVWFPDGYRMVVDPGKQLAVLCSGVGWGVSETRDDKLYAAVGMGSLALYRGCPILQELAIKLKQWGSVYDSRVLPTRDFDYKMFQRLGRDWEVQLREATPVPIHTLTRVFFARAFPQMDQYLWESTIRATSKTRATSRGLAFDVVHWAHTGITFPCLVLRSMPGMGY